MNGFKWVIGQLQASSLYGFFVIMLIAIKHYKHQKIIYMGWIIAFILVLSQVTAGAFIIFSRQNLYIALAHSLFIACFFGVMCYLLLLTSKE